jgi:hypothetical protein
MSETDDYLDRRVEFERVDADVTAVARGLGEIAAALTQKRGRFSFSNCPGGLPAEAVMSRDSVSANANDWKSPTQIMELLAKWHDAKSKMLSAWSAVPEHRRSALQAPRVEDERLGRWR